MTPHDVARELSTYAVADWITLAAFLFFGLFCLLSAWFVIRLIVRRVKLRDWLPCEAWIVIGALSLIWAAAGASGRL